MDRSLALVTLQALANTAVTYVLVEFNTVTVIIAILGLVLVGATAINGRKHH